jgi:hypothetical protein
VHLKAFKGRFEALEATALTLGEESEGGLQLVVATEYERCDINHRALLAYREDKDGSCAIGFEVLLADSSSLVGALSFKGLGLVDAKSVRTIPEADFVRLLDSLVTEADLANLDCTVEFRAKADDARILHDRLGFPKLSFLGNEVDMIFGVFVLKTQPTLVSLLVGPERSSEQQEFEFEGSQSVRLFITYARGDFALKFSDVFPSAPRLETLGGVP